MTSSFVPLESVFFTGGASMTSDSEPPAAVRGRRCKSPTPPSSAASDINGSRQATTRPPCPLGPMPAIPHHVPPQQQHHRAAVDEDFLREVDDSMHELCDLLPTMVASQEAERRRDIDMVLSRLDFLAEVVLRHERMLLAPQAALEARRTPPPVDASTDSRPPQSEMNGTPAGGRTPVMAASTVGRTPASRSSELMQSILEKVDAVNSIIERITPQRATAMKQRGGSSAAQPYEADSAALSAMHRVADALEAITVQVAQQGRLMESIQRSSIMTMSMAHSSSVVVTPADEAVLRRPAVSPQMPPYGQYDEVIDTSIPRSATGATSLEFTEIGQSVRRQRPIMTPPSSTASATGSRRSDSGAAAFDGRLPANEESPARFRMAPMPVCDSDTSSGDATGAAQAAAYDDFVEPMADEGSPRRERSVIADRLGQDLSAQRVGKATEFEDFIRSPQAARLDFGVTVPRQYATSPAVQTGARGSTVAKELEAFDSPRPLYSAASPGTGKKKQLSRSLFSDPAVARSDVSSSSASAASTRTGGSASTRSMTDRVIDSVLRENVSLKAQLHKQLVLNDSLMSRAHGADGTPGRPRFLE